MQIEILQEYNELVVLKDVVERHKVSNTVALRLFLQALYHSFSQKFSITGFWKLLNKGMQVKCSKNELFAFLNYLERECEIKPLLNAGKGLGISRKIIVTWDEEGSLDNETLIVPIWKCLIQSCQ